MEESSSNKQKITFGLREAVDLSLIVTKTDRDGFITFTNDNFCKISGYSRDELIGQQHNIVRHPDMPSSSFEDMWATIKSKKIWNGIIQNRHKDGSSYYVAATVTPSLDENNEIIEYISIRRDITELHNLKNNLERRVAEEIEKNRKKDESLIKNLHIFLDSTPNPMIVLDSHKKVKFVNTQFLKLIEKDKESMIDNYFNFSDILAKNSSYISEEKDLISHKANKIAIISNRRRIIFQLFYEEVKDVNNESLTIYTLNNITANEYHKLRIDYFNNQLQEYYMRHKKPLDTIEATLPNIEAEKTKIEEVAVEQNEIEKIDTADNRQKRELSDDERVLLKRKHSDLAVSSQEYANELDEYILTEIQELDEIESEIHNLIDALTNKTEKSLNQVVQHLLKFSSVLNSMMEFKELSFSISSLADLLSQQEISSLDETTYKKMLLFLENITLDLSSWRNIVFIEQSANDIHYMDSSLFSSILQLELIFNTEQKHEDEDDFELF